MTKEKIKKTLKNRAAAILAFAMLLLPAAALQAKQDGYDKMAEELSESSAKLVQKKVAILPFNYLDQRKSEGGAIVAERLTTRIVRLGKLQIIERQMLDKVVQELHLETTGIVDTETTKQLGKVLGVDAIITGTILDVEDGMSEVNARVIKTETAEVINTSSVEVKKIWSDTSVYQQEKGQQAQQQQPAASREEAAPENYGMKQQYQPQYYQAPTRPKGYFDIFTSGMDASTIDFTIENSRYLTTANELGFINVPATFRRVEFKKLTTKAVSGPLGIRFAGFGKNVGGDFELQYYSTQMKAQNTTASFNGGSPVGFTFFTNDYLKINTFTMAGDLLVRFSNGAVQPYVGLGVGLTIDRVLSPYISQYDSSGSGTFGRPLDDTGIGFTFRVPIGMRIELGDSFSFFGEWRISGNMFTFDRNINQEKDSVTVTGSNLLMGIGFGL